MCSLAVVLFRQVSISSHWAPIQFYAFFTAFWVLLLPCIRLVLLFHTTSSSNLSSHHRGREHLWWLMLFPATFFPKYLTGCISHCCIVVVIMVSMSMSSLLSPMSGANFPPTVAWKVQAISGSLSVSRSNLSLGWFAFLAFFRRTRKVSITRPWSLPMSAPGKLLIGSASSPRCYQSGCGVSHLGCAMSIFWMVCEGQGCLLKVAYSRSLRHLSFVSILQ